MIPPRAQFDHHAGLHRRDRLGVDEIFRFGSQRRVNGNDVRPPKELGKADHFHAHLLCPIGREIGIVRDDAHADALRELGQMAADLADPDDAEHFVEELDAHELVFFPLAGLTDVVACGMRRLMAQIIDIVFGRRDCVPPGVFMTTMPGRSPPAYPHCPGPIRHGRRLSISPPRQ